jgi:hypothetical protein
MRIKAFKIIFLLFAAWFIIHIVCITIEGSTDTKAQADAALIFGNKVNKDGSLSERLKSIR